MYQLLRTISIRQRISIILFAGIVGVALLVWVSVQHAKQQYVQLEKDNTRNLVESAKKVAQYFYLRVQSGELTSAQGKHAAANALKNIALSNRSYVYIYHDLNFMVMHPLLAHQSHPDLNAEDLAYGVANSEAQMEQHRVRYGLAQWRPSPMQILAKHHPSTKSGYFDYLFVVDADGLGFIAEINDTQFLQGAVAKIGYGAYFKPWSWSIIGSVYLGDVEIAINRSLRGLIPILLAIAGILGWISWTISRSITKPIAEGLITLNGILSENKFSLPTLEKGDEIERFSIAFATLIEQLEQRDDALRQKSSQLLKSNQQLTEHKLALEHTVAERTFDFKQAKETAEQATQAKSVFLATMSHELRTPMSGVIGIVDLLAQTQLDQSQRQYVNIIGSSGKQLLDIVGDILSFEKLAANKIILESEAFNLGKLCEELVAPFKLGEKPDLQYAIEIEPDCPLWLMGDSLRLKQVINNLLSNACKFTDSGSIKIQVKAIQKQTDDFIWVSVMDTGIGLTPKQQQLIFEDYHQATQSTAREYGGTGLGLAISKKIVELMGGAIAVRSEPLLGSSFYFDFPMMVASEHPLIPIAEPDARVIDDQHSRLTVLVAEDNPVNRMVIEGYLKRLGITTIMAENGAVALKKFDSQRVDLILMDINMPIKDGLATTKAIRDLERQQHAQATPIFALTADISDSSQQQCLDVGMDGTLIKPINLNQLMPLLDAVAAKTLPP